MKIRKTQRARRDILLKEIVRKKIKQGFAMIWEKNPNPCIKVHDKICSYVVWLVNVLKTQLNGPDLKCKAD